METEELPALASLQQLEDVKELKGIVTVWTRCEGHLQELRRLDHIEARRGNRDSSRAQWKALQQRTQQRWGHTIAEWLCWKCKSLREAGERAGKESKG